MKQTWFWPKLIGTALLAHIILILLSVIEVAIYAYLINPVKGVEDYEAHAQVSAPWVSVIGGALLFFWVTRWYMRRFSTRQLTFALSLPVVYIVFDVIILFMAGAGLDSIDAVFMLSKAVKLAASLLAFYLFRYRPARG